MPFHTALFDLDGTLIDHFKAIHRCHAHTLRALGMPEPTLDQVRSAVGGGLENAIARLAGPERVAESLALYLPHWHATMLDDVELLPGAVALLKSLQAAGITAAVVTNKRGDSARRICTHLGLDPFLAAVYGAGDTAWLKPQPEFLDHVLTELGADRATTAFVGDSPYDVDAARHAGLEFIGVTTGTHRDDELRAAGAEHIFPDLPAAAPRLLGPPH